MDISRCVRPSLHLISNQPAMMNSRNLILLAAALLLLESSSAFVVRPAARPLPTFSETRIYSTKSEKEAKEINENSIFADADATVKKLSSEQQDLEVRSLVADDEWSGLAIEMTKVIGTAIIEDAKKKKDKVKNKTDEFMGTGDYSTADVLNALDQKVKSEVANLRGKDEYEIGDLALALDEISKDLACKVIGKDGDYEFGDLSRDVDARIKNVVADYCGKDAYEVGDLAAEVKKRTKARVLDFTGKDEWHFGDIAKEVNSRRQDWAKGYLGEETWEHYETGDFTKKVLGDLKAFKEGHSVGDVSKDAAKKAVKKAAKAAKNKLMSKMKGAFGESPDSSP